MSGRPPAWNISDDHKIHILGRLGEVLENFSSVGWVELCQLIGDPGLSGSPFNYDPKQISELTGIHETTVSKIKEMDRLMSEILVEFGSKKIGFKFTCGDLDCRTCTAGQGYHFPMCTDWEVAQLYRKVGFEETREHMMKIADTNDLYLMMGTIAHKFAKFINVGIFYPPKGLEKIGVLKDKK